MSNERDKTDLTPAYSALTEGELLTLTTEQGSLTEAAKEALAAELGRRGLGEADVATLRQGLENTVARRARWRRAQRLRLRELLSILLIWPGMFVIPFALAIGLVFALDPVLRSVLGLNQRQINLYEEITAITVVLVCALVAAALILSDRSDAMLRRWIPSRDREPKSDEGKLWAHQRICPARNFGNALLLFLFSLYLLFLSVRDVEGWSFLREHSPQIGSSYIGTAGGIFLIIFCLYFVLKAPCFREKLWFAFATPNFVLDLTKHLVRNLSARELNLSRDISLGLWAAVTIIALSFVKSAWQGPATRNLDRQL